MKKQEFLQRIAHPIWFRLYLLWKLPSAFFMGLQIRYCDGASASVALPYSWRSQNPFRSTYFAAQCAAGEMATGILCLAALQEQPPVSMLVQEIRAEFMKKADQTLTFTCAEGDEAETAVRRAVGSGKAQSITMRATGLLPDGAHASTVWITWSFKKKA